MRERYLVEGNGEAKETVDNIRIVVELLVNHECKDSHLSTKKKISMKNIYQRSRLILKLTWAARPLLSSMAFFFSMVASSQPDALS